MVTNRTLPGAFAELTGVAIHDFDPQLNEEQEVMGPGEQHFPARVWSDILPQLTPRPKPRRITAKATTRGRRP